MSYVTLDSAECLAALQGMVRDLGSDIAAVQWATLAYRNSVGYEIIASHLPAKRALVNKLASGTHLTASYVDDMIAGMVRDFHLDRCACLHTPYDIDAAMAIDPTAVTA